MAWDMKKEVLEVCGIGDPNRLSKNGVYSIGQRLCISTPHFLNQTLYLYVYQGDRTCENYEREFYKFANQPENRHESWFELMEDFAEKRNLDVIQAGDTRNVDNDLDQDFQFLLFHHYDDPSQDIVILSAYTENGMTRPKVFGVHEVDSFLNWKIDCYCEHCKNEDRSLMELISDGPTLICKKCGQQVWFHSVAMGS